MPGFLGSLKELRSQRNLAREALLATGSADFKPETTARWVSLKKAFNGIIQVQIEHDTIKGCTPQMLRWWFENLGQTTTWNGQDFSGPEISVYFLWHHRDHIAVTPLSDGPNGQTNKGFLPGTRSRIEEKFNDYRADINADVTTLTLDEKEFTFTVKKFGLTIAKIVHLYSPEGNDLRFYTESRIGAQLPIIGFLFNWIVMPWIYSKKNGEQWIRHNIEESGQTEKFLPILYRHHIKESCTQEKSE